MTANGVEHRLSPLPDTGYVYRTAWRVATGDIDGDLHLRLDGVARYIQEVGAENLVDAGEADDHPHWLVQRTVIDVIEPIEFPERSIVQSVVLGAFDPMVHDARRSRRQRRGPHRDRGLLDRHQQ